MSDGKTDYFGGFVDLLKFGIAKKYDSEAPKQTILIRDPAVQYTANDAGSVQRDGTTQPQTPMDSAPNWVKWAGAGLAGVGLLVGVKALVK